MKKRSAILMGILVCGLSMAAVGCGGAKAGAGAQSGAEKASEAGGKSAKHVGIIFTEAGLGGNSFNDLALEGVKRAAEDFGITYDAVEPKSVSDEEIIQDEMASSGEYDLVICVGAEQVDALNNVAAAYPEQRFALLDASSDLENVASYSCKEQEGSFLAGALAALAGQGKIDEKINDQKVIGFIGGVDNPLINHFAAGYRAGAQYIDPETTVLIAVSYTHLGAKPAGRALGGEKPADFLKARRVGPVHIHPQRPVSVDVDKARHNPQPACVHGLVEGRPCAVAHAGYFTVLQQKLRPLKAAVVVDVGIFYECAHRKAPFPSVVHVGRAGAVLRSLARVHLVLHHQVHGAQLEGLRQRQNVRIRPHEFLLRVLQGLLDGGSRL